MTKNILIVARLDPATYEALLALAQRAHEGNVSRAVRECIRVTAGEPIRDNAGDAVMGDAPAQR